MSCVAKLRLSYRSLAASELQAPSCSEDNEFATCDNGEIAAGHAGREMRKVANLAAIQKLFRTSALRTCQMCKEWTLIVALRNLYFT